MTEHEPAVDQHARPDLDETPMGLVPSQREIEARSEMARWIPPHVFPAGREELLASLDAATPPGIVRDIKHLPGDQQYENVQTIWSALGHPVEGAHTGRRQDGHD